MSDSGRQIGDCKHGNTRETCRECAFAELQRLRAGQMYRIKRLEWENHTTIYVARTAIGNFLVGKRSVDFAKGGVTHGRDCTDMDDGKRVAQEWFEELMREGLEEVK